MFNKFDLMLFNLCKKLFYMLPGDPILGMPIGQMVSLIVLIFGFEEAVTYFMPNAANKKKKVNKK